MVKVFRLRLTRTSKNGISWFSSNSIVKLIFGCLVLRYYRNLVAEATLSNNAKMSSTYLNQMEGRESTLATHFSSKLHMKMFANTGPSGHPMVSLWGCFYLVTSSPLYFCIFLNVCNSYNRSLLKMYHALSMDNVCNRCLFSIPSKVEMAEEQEYLDISYFN